MQDFHSLKFDEILNFMHLFFLGVFFLIFTSTFWPLFHSGFIIKQSFCHHYFHGINELGLGYK